MAILSVVKRVARVAALLAINVWLGAVLAGSAAGAATVDSTVLIFARDDYSASSAAAGLQGYGIPYEAVIVPQAGITLPALNSSATEGNYGGIIVVSEVAYSFGTGWGSAITADQWEQLFAYQSAFGVRMVRLDAYPGPDFGVTTTIPDEGCCDAGVEQLVSLTDSTAFSTANIKTNVGVSTDGLWHYPATITNASIASQVASFAPAGQFTSPSTAAVINKIGAREQFVWFMGWAADWSQTSNFLQHAHIHWMTRGLFLGKRKVYLNTQVDDMHLDTEMYYPAGEVFRIRTGDLDAHKPWQADLNSRLPAGSDYVIEIGHNGNGDIIIATDSEQGEFTCNPEEAVDYPYPADTPLEFQKPLGTGTDLWPEEFVNYTWSLQCAKLDDVATWFMEPANRDAFAHVSHTFTHEELNNATYHDAAREVAFNIDWLKQVGLWDAARFSPAGLIPPAITGLHNGDAIRAWMDNGIRYVVGDNTRPVLRNSRSSFWPYVTEEGADGHAGLVVVPRFATTIYYNCDDAECTTREWTETSGGAGGFEALLRDAKATNTRYLLGLHPDAYMFHQANLRQTDVASFTVGDQSGQLSLLQIWVETVAQEMTRLTDWPIGSLKHDDLGRLFVDRMTLDNCNPRLAYTYNAAATAITGVTVTADGNTCGVPVPVTFPVSSATASGGSARADKVGSEPLIMWATLAGSPVTFVLDSPVAL